MPKQRPFEMIVKDHVDKGADIHTAFGRAITEDPEAYTDYIKRQKQVTIDGGMTDGEALKAAAGIT